MHSKLFLHRDVKPDNFLIGLGPKSSVVYAIDFGLAKRYIVSSTGMHIPYRNNKNLTGTARYASVNTHLGIEQSRRDDIEGIAFVTLYFLRGSLPWQGLPAKTKQEKYRRILESKLSTTPEILCKGLPSTFPGRRFARRRRAHVHAQVRSFHQVRGGAQLRIHKKAAQGHRAAQQLRIRLLLRLA